MVVRNRRISADRGTRLVHNIQNVSYLAQIPEVSKTALGRWQTVKE